MTAGELIAKLSEHNPDLPVRLHRVIHVSYDEGDFAPRPPADVCEVDRVLTDPTGPYLELMA